MGIPTILLLTTVSVCAMGQLTREPGLSTTESRVSCLEDSFMRVESSGISMRRMMAVIEATNDAQNGEINALNTDIEELNSQLREHAAVKTAQRDEINALKAAYEELQSQLGENAVELSCNETFDLISSLRYGVPDSSITASSESSGFPARASRLNSTTCWAANYNSARPHWINVDLGQRRIVTEIRTRGNGMVFVLRDSPFQQAVMENDKDVLFEGNDDVDTIVTTLLPAPIHTRFVCLNAVEWYGYRPGIRWAIDGCPVA